MDKNIGKKLDGRYEISELIGIGGMADVYKAIDIIDNKVVAVKILKNEFSENEEFLRRFRNESKAIAVLSHPNIVKVLDVGFTDKIQFIVMEYIDGITLKEYMEQQGALSWKDSVHFITQILRALQHAHDRGIVHRDIKPQNIMLFTDGTIKVMDFGIAKFAREEGKTISEKAIGSVHYISPEQARGDVTDEKSDIYSLGIMFYEMLTGQKPFDGDTPVSIALMHMQNEAKRPTEINPAISKGLEEIVLRAMEKEPSKRYKSASEMIKDLDKFKANPDVVFDYVTAKADNGATKFFTPVSAASQVVDDDDEDEVYYEDDEYENDEDEESDEDGEEEEKASFFVPTLTAVAIVVIIVAVFFVAALISKTMKGNNDEFSMPTLVGSNYNDAIADNEDLDIKVISTEYSKYEKDAIFEQSVEAGSPVKKGTVVEVKVSLGVKKVAIPDIEGFTEEQARDMLKQDGFSCRVITEASDTVEAQKVIRTEPPIGEEADATSTEVLVYVSMGATDEITTLPDLSGSTVEDAKAVLDAKGFKNITTIEVDSNRAKGEVDSQTPEAGKQINKKDQITLKVSNGNPVAAKTEISIEIPKGAGGKVTISLFDESGISVGTQTIDELSYAVSPVKIAVTGTGTKKITAQVNNDGTGKKAIIGQFNVNFTTKVVTQISYNKNAFNEVGAIVTTTTKPVTTTSQPTVTQSTDTTKDTSVTSNPDDVVYADGH